MTGETSSGCRYGSTPSPNTVCCSSPSTPGRLISSNPSVLASASSTPNSNLYTPHQRTPLSRNSSNGSSSGGRTSKNKSYLKHSQSKTPDSKSARQTVLQAMNAALHPHHHHHQGHDEHGYGHGSSSPTSRKNDSNNNSHNDSGGGGIFRKWGQRRNSILGGGAGNRRASMTGSSPASSTGSQSHPPPTTTGRADDDHNNILLHQNVGWKSLDDSCDTFDLTDDDDLCLTGVKPPSSYILTKASEDDATKGDKRDASITTATTIRESFSTITSNSLNGSSNNGNDSSTMGFFIGGSGLSIVNGSSSFVMPSGLDAPVPADQVPQFSASKLVTPKQQQQQKAILPKSAGKKTPTPTSAKSTPGGKKSAAAGKATPKTKLSRPPRPSPAPTKRSTEPKTKDSHTNEQKSKTGDVDEGFMEAMNSSTLDMYKSSPAIEYALAAAKDRYKMPFGSPKPPPPERPKSKSPPARSKSEQTPKNEKNGDESKEEETTKTRGIGRSKSADDAALLVDTTATKKDKKGSTRKKKPKKAKSLPKQKPSEKLTSPENTTKSKKTKTKKKSKQEAKEVSSGVSDSLESETIRPLPKRKPQRQKSSSALATRDQQSPQARKKTPKRSMSAPSKKNEANSTSDNGPINYVPIESLNLTPKTIMSAQEKSPTKAARRPVGPSYVHTDNTPMDDDTSITSRSNSIQSIQAHANKGVNGLEPSSETFELSEHPIEDEIAVEVEMAQAFAAIPDTPKSPSQRNGHSWVASERSKTFSPSRSPSGRSTRTARTTRSIGISLNDRSTHSTRTTALVDTSSPGRYQRRCRRKAERSSSQSTSMPRRFSGSALSSTTTSSQRPYAEELLATASARRPVSSVPLRRRSSFAADGEYSQRPYAEELLTATSTRRSTSEGTTRPRLNRSRSHGSIRGENNENHHHNITVRRGTRRDRNVTRSDAPTTRRSNSFTIDRTTNSWADLRQKLSNQHSSGVANENFQGPRRSRLASRARSRSHDLPSSSSHSNSSVSISSVES